MACMSRKSRPKARTKNRVSAGASLRKLGKASRPQARSTVEILLKEYDPKNLSYLDWRATNGPYIDGKELADAIAANPGQSLPDGLRDYLCRFLRGKVKRKRGPKRSYRFGIELLAAETYEEELHRLQNQQRRSRGRDAIGSGELPPHEEALRIVKERFGPWFGSISTRRIANIISSHN